MNSGNHHIWNMKETVNSWKNSQKRLQLSTRKQTGSLFYLCGAIATSTCKMKKQHRKWKWNGAFSTVHAFPSLHARSNLPSLNKINQAEMPSLNVTAFTNRKSDSGFDFKERKEKSTAMSETILWINNFKIWLPSQCYSYSNTDGSPAGNLFFNKPEWFGDLDPIFRKKNTFFY